MIRGYLYSIQQGLLYGSVKIANGEKITKMLAKEIDSFFDGLLRKMNGLS